MEVLIASAAISGKPGVARLLPMQGQVSHPRPTGDSRERGHPLSRSRKLPEMKPGYKRPRSVEVEPGEGPSAVSTVVPARCGRISRRTRLPAKRPMPGPRTTRVGNLALFEVREPGHSPPLARPRSSGGCVGVSASRLVPSSPLPTLPFEVLSPVENGDRVRRPERASARRRSGAVPALGVSYAPTSVRR